MECIFCKGTMERGFAPFQVDRKNYHLTLEKVPAWICTQCGEKYFEANEVEKIQELLENIDSQTSNFSQVA